MLRKSCLSILVAFSLYVVIGGTTLLVRCYQVAQESARLNGTDPQVEFTILMEQEQQSLFGGYWFFWPQMPDTPRGTSALTVLVQDSYGFYQDKTGRYDYTVHIERLECGEDLCPATITFTNEYADFLWVDFFDYKKSIKIQNGDTILLPGLNKTNWDVGAGRPFFEDAEEPIAPFNSDLEVQA